MARIKNCRYVGAMPPVNYFKPRGIPLVDLEEASLAVEELEAIRLCDLEGLSILEAAEKMGVSRHTLGRVLGTARHTVAEALCRGQALRIEGGVYAVRPFAGGAVKENSCAGLDAADGPSCCRGASSSRMEERDGEPDLSPESGASR